jgi:hypothetical protein
MNTHPTYRISQVIAASDEYTAPIFRERPGGDPVAEATAEKNWFDPLQGGFVARTGDDFSGCRPPMCRIAGVSPDVLRRAAIAATAATGEAL